MIELRPFATLGRADHGWLDAAHHFSFASYRDDARMNWGSLRVWNDDAIAPHSGFAPHGHRDMEIITYVREGAITHRDSMGNEGRTGAGDVQVMSAGTGVEHSEFNREDETTRLFQIWIVPDRPGGPPAWSAREFPKGVAGEGFVTLASGMAGDDALPVPALPIRADARVAAARLSSGESARYTLAPGRHAYLVPATGRVRVNGVEADARDGIAIRNVADFTVEALSDSDVVLVDSR